MTPVGVILSPPIADEGSGLRNEKMWLPKDERHLLLGYYVSIGNDEEEVWFALEEWAHIFEGSLTRVPILAPWQIKRLARKAKHYRVLDEPLNINQNNNKQDTVNADKIRTANKRLENRGFIKLRRNHCGSMMGITLKIEGYDLGRKYNAWWTRTGVWFAEYRYHWIWVIGSFLAGIAGTLLVRWLSKIII
jgi:hypothetical protein